MWVIAAPPGDPVLTAAATDHLARAAESLQRGDQLAAAGHLAKHVRSFPDQVMVRAHLAELLFREKQYAAATDQYERFIADAGAHTLGDRVAWIIVEGELVQDGELVGPGGFLYPESLVAAYPRLR